MQADSIADRFQRWLHGEPRYLEDGGLAVEALQLIQAHGLVARSDFHNFVESDSIFIAIADKLSHYADLSQKENVLERELHVWLGASPLRTHLGRETRTPLQMAHEVLQGQQWVEFDLSRDGYEGVGVSHDPDARRDTLVFYTRQSKLVELIHRSLAAGQAVVWGSLDHAMVIYGAEYDRQGQAISYMVKDTFPPYTYRLRAKNLQRLLNDVTVTRAVACL